jgi:hypothetical protein
MRRWGVLGFLAVAVALAAPASAKDMNGKFGVGFDQSIGGVSGVNLKYFIGDFSIWLTPGVDLFAVKDGDTAVAFGVALGGIYNFARSDAANLGAGLRVDFGYSKKAAGDTWQVGIEVPLVAEYFFTDHFALHFSTAIVIQIVPGSGPALHAPTPGGLGEQASSSTTTMHCVVTDKNTGEMDCTTTGTASKGNEGVGFSLGAAGIAGSLGFTFYF